MNPQACKDRELPDSEDVTVVRDLSKDFDGSTSDRAILIGRGYPCDGADDETSILGNDCL